jgi:hypothetical protein
LEQICTTNSDADRTFTVSTEQVVNDFLKQPLLDRVRATTHSEIALIVRHLKTHKVAGPNGVQNIIRQQLPRLVLKFFAKLFNNSLGPKLFSYIMERGYNYYASETRYVPTKL